MGLAAQGRIFRLDQNAHRLGTFAHGLKRRGYQGGPGLLAADGFASLAADGFDVRKTDGGHRQQQREQRRAGSEQRISEFQCLQIEDHVNGLVRRICERVIHRRR